MTAEAPALLGEEADEPAARRLAARLVAEGIGAQAVGPQVWVRAADRSEALVLARLFHEVDQGRSRVAAPPGAWSSGRRGTVARVAVTVTLAVAVLAALVVAVQLR